MATTTSRTSTPPLSTTTTKRAKVEAQSGESATITCSDGSRVDVDFVPPSSWLGEKHSTPWSYFNMYRTRASSSSGDSRSFLKCGVCDYVKELTAHDDNPGNFNKHLETHFKNTKMWQREASNCNEDDVEDDKRQFVRGVLISGLPYSPLTSALSPLYQTLKRKNIAVSSNTFRRMAGQMADEAIDAIDARLHGSHGIHLALETDASPSIATDQFIETIGHYIDEEGAYHTVPLVARSRVLINSHYETGTV
jgi:hypothetical protein